MDVTTPECGSMVVYLSNFKGRKSLSLKLPSKKKLALKGIGYVVPNEIGDQLHTKIKERGAKLINKKAERANPFVPYRVRIEIVAAINVRQRILKTALMKVLTRNTLQ